MDRNCWYDGYYYKIEGYSVTGDDDVQKLVLDHQTGLSWIFW